MNRERKRLYYFTASFPYGLGETWKSNELRFLVEYFDEIVVVPYSYGKNFNNPKTLPAGVRAEKPLFETDEIPVNKLSFLKLFDKHFFYYLREFFNKKVFLSRKKIFPWLYSSLQVKRLMAHPLIQNLVNHPDKNTTLYFFWGKGSCDFLPFIKKNKYGNIVVRFHRYDLFEDQNNGYIPYRGPLLRSAKILAPSSHNGLNHLSSLYPQERSHMRVIPLGVIGNGTINMSHDNVLRILSCSYVVEVKRVHIIAEALRMMTIPVIWTHVGDGPLMESVKKIINQFPSNIKVVLPGMVATPELISYYKKSDYDLFINVSSSEGVAVSVMESLSLSIPVFATDVGGMSDIIDDTVGKLLPADVTPDQLAGFLSDYYQLPVEKKQQIKSAAHKRYLDRCNAETLTRQLGELLIDEMQKKS